MTDSLGDIGVQEATPRHKFNVGAITNLPRGFSASFNLGYKDKYRYANTVADSIPAYWRLDARLAYQIKDVELFVAGQNLTRPLHHFEFQRSLDVPRTYYGGASIKF